MKMLIKSLNIDKGPLRCKSIVLRTESLGSKNTIPLHLDMVMVPVKWITKATSASGGLKNLCLISFLGKFVYLVIKFDYFRVSF